MTTDLKTGLAKKIEARRYLNLSQRGLESLIRNGDLETRKVGTETRVTWHSVYVYLGEIESNSEQ